LIESQYQRAKSLLLENLDKLHALAADLMANEVIFKENMEAIFGVRPWKSKQDILDELALEADAAKAEGVRQANLADRPSDESTDSPEAADQNAAVTASGDHTTEPTSESVAEEPKSDTEATNLDAKN
jgi:cell division protease FtsH